MTFYQQLLLLIIGDLVIAVIILFWGLRINKKLEAFKTQLTRLSLEHQIRFSELHENGAKLISRLRVLMHDARTQISALQVGIEDKLPDQVIEGLAKNASRPISKAIPLLDENCLFLSQEMAGSISDILTTMGTMSTTSIHEESRSKALARWREQSARIDKIMFDLEDEFRMVLGSNIDSSTNIVKE